MDTSIVRKMLKEFDLSSVSSVLSPKKPQNLSGWQRCELTEKRIFQVFEFMNLYPPQVWIHDCGIKVISGLEKVTPSGKELDIGAEYHLSISINGGRANLHDCKWTLAQFGLEDAQEDNHLSGVARQFWRAVADQYSGYVCPCQSEETAIVEDKGNYVWRPV